MAKLGSTQIFGDLKVQGDSYIDGNKVWHAGNDGSGSGLDADLLDGKHASAFALKTDLASGSAITITQPVLVNGSTKYLVGINGQGNLTTQTTTLATTGDLIIKAPNGTYWKVLVNASGALYTQSTTTASSKEIYLQAPPPYGLIVKLCVLNDGSLSTGPICDIDVIRDNEVSTSKTLSSFEILRRLEDVGGGGVGGLVFDSKYAYTGAATKENDTACETGQCISFNTLTTSSATHITFKTHDIPLGSCTAIFRLSTSSNQYTTSTIQLIVQRHSGGSTTNLAVLDVKSSQFTAANTYQTFMLPFDYNGTSDSNEYIQILVQSFQTSAAIKIKLDNVLIQRGHSGVIPRYSTVPTQLPVGTMWIQI